jgi:hypothetical protein
MLLRRKYQRFPTNAPVVCQWKADNLVRVEEGIARDISTGGMYIVGAHAPPAKLVVRCKVLLPALESDPPPFACTVADMVGRVLRDETKTGPPNGFAIQCRALVLNAR